MNGCTCSFRYLFRIELFMCRYYFLGNTCYMNSMLQCFAQMPPLTTPFRDGTYKAMVNRNNSFGTGGQLSDAWAELLKKMSSGRSRYIVPRGFKQVLTFIYL